MTVTRLKDPSIVAGRGNGQTIIIAAQAAVDVSLAVIRSRTTLALCRPTAANSSSSRPKRSKEPKLCVKQCMESEEFRSDSGGKRI